MKNLGTIEVLMATAAPHRLIIEGDGRRVCLVLDHSTARYLAEKLRQWADERAAEAATTRGLFK